MIIYQIHRYGGAYEDFYDYIEESYVSQEKAQLRLKQLVEEESKLKKQRDLCNECQVYFGNSDKANEKCKCADVYYDKEYNEYDCYNRVCFGEDNNFTIEEVEVIE